MATSHSPLTGQQSPTEYVHLLSPFPFLLSSPTLQPGKRFPVVPKTGVPKFLDSILTLARSSSVHEHEHEITHIQTTLSKLSDKKLASQRYMPSQEKTESLSKLALGAKLDRALARRMGSQDAVMRVKDTNLNEKISEKLAAN